MSIRTAAFLLSSTLALQVVARDGSAPKQNTYLSAARYGARQYNPQHPTSFPYAVPTGTYQVELPKFPRVIGGPVSYMQFASTQPDYMWATTTGSVAYVDTSEKRWHEVARLATAGVTLIPRATLDKFTARRISSVAEAEAITKELHVDGDRLDNNAHALVDRDNVLFASSSEGMIHAYGLIDPQRPSAGIKTLRSLDLRDQLKRLTAASTSASLKQAGLGVTALALTHDGNLVIGTSRSVSVTSRDFQSKLHTIEFGPADVVRNAVAVDEKGGIYVATDTALHKLVWTGQTLSTAAAHGAWSSPYDGGREPPTVKQGPGSGGPPTLMGFGGDPDKLVVITDGSDRMKLVAFWRDAIPADFKQQPGTKSRRIAGQIEVGAGLSPKPEFIQTEKPVVVYGYGAFVVNSVRKSADPDPLIDVMVSGPVYDPAVGMERFEWSPAKRKWHSVWARADVAVASMTPAVSTVSNVVLVNGYTRADGWELTGLSWTTGDTVHRSLFGQDPLGNGAYAQIQFLSNGDLLMNSIGGPIRVHHRAVLARPKT